MQVNSRKFATIGRTSALFIQTFCKAFTCTVRFFILRKCKGEPCPKILMWIRDDYSPSYIFGLPHTHWCVQCVAPTVKLWMKGCGLSFYLFLAIIAVEWRLCGDFDIFDNASRLFLSSFLVWSNGLKTYCVFVGKIALLALLTFYWIHWYDPNQNQDKATKASSVLAPCGLPFW